jgi:hypothetical protein
MTDTDPEILKQIYIDLVEFNDWVNRPTKEELELLRLTQIPIEDTRTEKEKTLSKLGCTVKLLFLQCATNPCDEKVTLEEMQIQECIDIRNMDKDYNDSYLYEEAEFEKQMKFAQ